MVSIHITNYAHIRKIMLSNVGVNKTEPIHVSTFILWTLIRRVDIKYNKFIIYIIIIVDMNFLMTRRELV